MKVYNSSKELCYRSDGSTFIRDHLQKLQVKKLEKQSAYINETDTLKLTDISNNYSTVFEFIEKTRTAFMSRRLLEKNSMLSTIFRFPPFKDMAKPSCDGLWMEFGVYRGDSISHIARWKTEYCGKKSEPVYGFDTFTGLPTNWRPGFDRGAFAIPKGKNVSVPSNVVLVSGLFIETLPTHLRIMDRKYQCKTTVSFIHVDCDIYDGARDILFLLGSRFVTGTIILFDELFNYPGYEKHEIKALFEFLSGSSLRLKPLSTYYHIESKPAKDREGQSFAFVVDAPEGT
ncbi:unnamed protein product [Rotaria sp. Silwood2]|nr:unnamed protein product [Rotaria sp. Silwood2]CAF4188993.1 unnamed protein product [Rotaria sp. Silwood2]